MYNNNKIVIFDWGGIVESHFTGEFNCFTARKEILSKINPNLETENLDIISQKWDECRHDENGINISTQNDIKDVEKWFKRLKLKFELNCSFEEFCYTYIEVSKQTTYYKNVAEYARSLKEKCKIGILSSLCKLDEPRIDMHYHLSEFDYVWLSFKLDCDKPDEMIYKIVEEECGIPANNILFIDDRKENIETAQKRGWNTCHTTGQTLEKIKTCVDNFLGE